MTKKWDHFEYKIAGHYMSALINADFSGLDDRESQELEEFERQAYADARASGWTVGHWAMEPDDNADDWGRCDVSELGAMRTAVRLIIYRETKE